MLLWLKPYLTVDNKLIKMTYPAKLIKAPQKRQYPPPEIS